MEMSPSPANKRQKSHGVVHPSKSEATPSSTRRVLFQTDNHLTTYTTKHTEPTASTSTRQREDEVTLLLEKLDLNARE